MEDKALTVIALHTGAYEICNTCLNGPLIALHETSPVTTFCLRCFDGNSLTLAPYIPSIFMKWLAKYIHAETTSQEEKGVLKAMIAATVHYCGRNRSDVLTPSWVLSLVCMKFLAFHKLTRLFCLPLFGYKKEMSKLFKCMTVEVNMSLNHPHCGF